VPYIALGIDMAGKKDALGMYVWVNESAKFWLSIMNGLKNRGVEDIKKLMADLKLMYAAPTRETALQELELFREKWDSKYPKIYMA
jgi:putative transposase